MARLFKKDIVGKTFGRLKVLYWTGNMGSGKGSVWMCECSCGKVKPIRRAQLVQGHSRSCGCLAKELKSSPKKSSQEVGFNYVFSRYQVGAKKRDIQFNLTKEQFANLSKQDCFYCGAAPKNVKSSRRREYIGNGLDRVNNVGDYTLNNVVACCATCNRMKLELSLEEFKNQVKRIHLKFNQG